MAVCQIGLKGRVRFRDDNAAEGIPVDPVLTVDRIEDVAEQALDMVLLPSVTALKVRKHEPKKSGKKV